MIQLKRSLCSANTKLLLITAALLFGRYPLSWLLSGGGRRMRPDRFKNQQTQLLSRPGGNTFFVEFDGAADSPPVVLIHGLNSDSRQWYHQRRWLRRHFRLVLVDLPGHGRSPRPSDLSVAALAADLHHLVKTLRLESPVFYGHSLGSMLILQYFKDGHRPLPGAAILQQSAYENPLRHTALGPVLAMIQKPVLRPFLDFVKKHPALFQVLGWVSYLSGLSAAFYRFIFFTGRQPAADLRLMARLAVNCPPDVVAEAILQMMSFDASAAMAEIEAPCLVLSGNQDRISRPYTAAYEAAKIPGARHEQLPGGHLALVEWPEATNHAIAAFLHTR
ncbi:alpha/beta fold hydrolase [Pedobacter yulinensis]|nr:alpha/beta hydrolase [Pedobacter yulinensis]